MPDRVVSPQRNQDEASLDLSLRPKQLTEYIGQDKVKGNLKILLEAARARHEAVDHILLYGPPGLGKTTLAAIVAHEMDVQIKTTSGPAIERPGDLAAIVTNLRANEILFVDEIHRLARPVEEILYPAMEDFALDIVIGKGPSAKSIRLKLPRFTIIGATTRYAMLSAPLRDRFGAVYRLDFYDQTAMETIVDRSAKILEIHIDPAGVKEIDRRVLRTIIEKFGGGPVGLPTIAASISEEADTIMDVVEPYLLQLGFLDRTPRGRIATPSAYKHLGKDVPERPEQRTMFEPDE